MELARVLAIAKLRAAIAHHRNEETTLRTLVTISEFESVRKLATLDLIQIADQIAADLEEIKKFEAE